jgi:hypothetical protein
VDTYQVGQLATLSIEFLNGSGALADPATVALTITTPGGVSTTYTFAGGQITRDATGKYHFDLTVNAAGAWTWQWNTTGTPTTTSTGYLVAVPAGSEGARDSVAPWASLAELAAQNTLVAAATGAQVGLAEFYLQVASNLAYAASARQFPGIVESVVRPSRRESAINPWPAWWTMGQNVSPWGLCICNLEPHRNCGCGVLSEVWLADVVQAIIQVYVNGAIVPATSYAVHDRMYLVRTDGQGWPCCQDFTQDPTLSTSTNSFQVTYLRGKQPPPEGRQAVIDMAGEFYAAKAGGDCALPSAVQQLVREGVSMTLADPIGINLFQTGIRSWDYFVEAHNPKHRARRATFLSPDVQPRYRKVGVY